MGLIDVSFWSSIRSLLCLSNLRGLEIQIEPRVPRAIQNQRRNHSYVDWFVPPIFHHVSLKGLFAATLCPALALYLAQHGLSQAYCGFETYGWGYHIFSFFMIWIGTGKTDFIRIVFTWRLVVFPIPLSGPLLLFHVERAQDSPHAV